MNESVESAHVRLATLERELEMIRAHYVTKDELAKVELSFWRWAFVAANLAFVAVIVLAAKFIR